MVHLRLLFIRLRYDRQAVTSLEYAIIAAIMTAVGLAGFSIVGTDVLEKMNILRNAVPG